MIIGKGETYTAKQGEIIHFCVGSVTTEYNKPKLRMFIKEVDLITTDKGLAELDGGKLDLRKYTIAISKKAFSSYLKHFEF